MARLALYLLGPPGVEVDGSPVEFPRHKVLALLIYLAMTGQRHSRDSLTELLFGDQDRAHAQSSFRQTLSLLGRAVRRDSIGADRHCVWLPPSGDLRMDVTDYRRLLESGRSAERKGDLSSASDRLEKAAALFRGAFLSGFYLKHCPVFEDWQRREEENLCLEQLFVLQRLVQIHDTLGQYEQAIDFGER